MSAGITNAMDKLDLKGRGNATVAIHADDPLNVVTDVAPPLHVSTTFRYSDDPNDLHAWADYSVRICLQWHGVRLDTD